MTMDKKKRNGLIIAGLFATALGGGWMAHETSDNKKASGAENAAASLNSKSSPLVSGTGEPTVIFAGKDKFAKAAEYNKTHARPYAHKKPGAIGGNEEITWGGDTGNNVGTSNEKAFADSTSTSISETFQSTGSVAYFGGGGYIGGGGGYIIIPDKPGTPDVPPPSAVPEPATWTMMIAGFGLIGGAMRRQKAKQGAPSLDLA